MRKILLIVLLVLLTAPLLFARPTKGIAIGAQVGALATGVVADFPLGPVSLSLGINTPLIINYVMTQSGDLFENNIAPFFIVSGDFTYPFALGQHFDLKVGISSLAGTDFENGVIGVAGGIVKGEYWIPNKPIGLFMHMDLPIVVYIGGKEIGFTTATSWLIPLLGIFTTSAGVLWAF